MGRRSSDQMRHDYPVGTDRRRRLRWRLRRAVLIQGAGGMTFAGIAIAFLFDGRFAAGIVFLGIALVPLTIATYALIGLRRLKPGPTPNTSSHP